MKNLELKPGDFCDCLSFLEYSYYDGCTIPDLDIEVDLSEPCYCLIVKVEEPFYIVLFREGINKVFIKDKKDVSRVFKRVR